MKCSICGGPAHEPLTLTEQVHEMLCRADMHEWRTSPGFRLAEQLLELGQAALALAQYRDFTYRARAALGRVA